MCFSKTRERKRHEIQATKDSTHKSIKENSPDGNCTVGLERACLVWNRRTESPREMSACWRYEINKVSNMRMFESNNQRIGHWKSDEEFEKKLNNYIYTVILM